MLCISLLTVHFPHNHLLKDIIYHTDTGVISMNWVLLGVIHQSFRGV